MPSRYNLQWFARRELKALEPKGRIPVTPVTLIEKSYYLHGCMSRMMGPVGRGTTAMGEKAHGGKESEKFEVSSCMCQLDW